MPELLPEHHFNVARALVGTEGTCVTVLESDIGLIKNPPSALLVLGYRDIFTTGDHVPEVNAAGPVGLEALDRRLIKNMYRKHMAEEDPKLLPSGGGWLLAEFGGGTEKDAADQAHALMDVLAKRGDAPKMRLYTDPTDQEKIWKIRESGLGATAFVPGRNDNWPGWEDSAVAPEKVGDYLRDLKALFREFKAIWDPEGTMNPGKVVDPYPITSNMRIGPSYRPPELKTPAWCGVQASSTCRGLLAPGPRRIP